MAICDKDCLHCPYPDCINNELDYADYRASASLDREILSHRKTAKQKKLAAQQKAYREANREKLAAQQKAYREANREKLAAQQKAIQTFRKAVGLTQAEFADRLGITPSAVSLWERGEAPANWELLRLVFPDFPA